MTSRMPAAWLDLLPSSVQESLAHAEALVQQDIDAGHEVWPRPHKWYAALELTPPEAVRVLVLGQDPYHKPGEAQGLAFSVPAGVKTPPTLRNILKELASDVGVERSTTDLTDWAQQGVLLLNTALTVRQHTPRSYLDLGIWDPVVKALVAAVARSETPTAFILWGKDAEEFEPLITGSHHLIHKSAHPSPLAAYRGFWGSKPFTKVNAWLEGQGREAVVWA